MTAAQQPITPDRTDTGPMTIDPESAKIAAEFRRNALLGGYPVDVDGLRLSPQIIQDARLRENMRQAGTPILGDAEEDRRILEAAREVGYDEPSVQKKTRESVAAPLPPILDLDATTGESEHKVRVRRRNGDTITLEPTLTTGGVRMLHWYQGVIERLFARMASCENEDEAIGLNTELEGYREKQLRQVLPSLPVGLCQELSKGADRELAGFIRRVVDLAEGQTQQETTDPNG